MNHCKHDLPRWLCAVCRAEQRRAEYEDLAEMTGLSVTELEADLTAPDPGQDADDRAAHEYRLQREAYEQDRDVWRSSDRHGRH